MYRLRVRKRWAIVRVDQGERLLEVVAEFDHVWEALQALKELGYRTNA